MLGFFFYHFIHVYCIYPQVNEMKTQDFDCCLTVPLIAAAGDKIEMIMQRSE